MKMEHTSSGPFSGSRQVHHKIWTKKGPRLFPPGQVAHIPESERTSEVCTSYSLYLLSVLQDSSVDGRNTAEQDFSTVRNEQESIISGAGNLDRIIGVVSSFWDGADEKAASGPKGGSFSERPFSSSHPISDDRVGFLDPRRSFSRSAEAPARPSPQVQEPPPRPPVAPLPQEVRMITYSDAVARPDLLVPPPSAIPDVSESPFALLAAASGGKLDLHWLETFDTSTLETLVPRDPYTGRPLTIGSIDHAEGKCRPCIFFLKAKCFKGLRCTFCHFNHTSMRKSVETVPSQIDLQSMLFPPPKDSSGASSTGKSKRLRPSKRTREMIKQINEQMLLEDIEEDPHGPPLSVTQNPAISPE